LLECFFEQILLLQLINTPTLASYLLVQKRRRVLNQWSNVLTNRLDREHYTQQMLSLTKTNTQNRKNSFKESHTTNIEVELARPAIASRTEQTFNNKMITGQHTPATHTLHTQGTIVKRTDIRLNLSSCTNSHQVGQNSKTSWWVLKRS